MCHKSLIICVLYPLEASPKPSLFGDTARPETARLFSHTHSAELAGLFVKVCNLHKPFILWVAGFDFARVGFHVLGYSDHDSEQTIALIPRPDQVVDSFAISRTVGPGKKVRAIESIIDYRFRLVVETVSPQCNYDRLSTV